MATVEQGTETERGADALRRTVERHLREKDPHLKVLEVRPLGADATRTDATYKALGYGDPLAVVARSGGVERRYVLHFFAADGHGHDRHADRVAEALLAAATYPRVLSHVRAVDVGVVGPAGRWLSLAHVGEPYLLTE